MGSWTSQLENDARIRTLLIADHRPVLLLVAGVKTPGVPRLSQKHPSAFLNASFTSDNVVAGASG